MKASGPIVRLEEREMSIFRTLLNVVLTTIGCMIELAVMAVIGVAALLICILFAALYSRSKHRASAMKPPRYWLRAVSVRCGKFALTNLAVVAVFAAIAGAMRIMVI